MVTKNVIVKKETGLHARPGSEVVDLAMKFQSDIKLKKGDKVINAKEVLEILSADINFNDEIIIEANGVDEEEAVKALEEYIGS
mgnify:CR=1 FL=1